MKYFEEYGTNTMDMIGNALKEWGTMKFNAPDGHLLSGKRPMRTHVVVCPFCENGHPVPMDLDSIHRCTCGACYKICGERALENGVGDIAEELWNQDELDFVRSIPVDFCNVVIEKDFDRLLDLKHASDLLGIEKFCKYDINNPLNLVWVKRLF